MKKFLEGKKLLVVGILLSLAVMIGGIYSLSTDDADDIEVIYDTPTKDSKDISTNKYKIYLITMNMLDDFWKSMDTGCRSAADKLGNVDYKWIGPDVHEDALQSICINQAVDEGADAIILAASSLTGVNNSLKRADEAGVKIIYVDNAATYDCVAFLSTDNALAGRIAAETMQQTLAEAGITSGKIGVLSNQPTTISTELRSKGFREQFKGTAFTVTDTLYMEDNPQRINDFVRANTDYAAFFASNEMTATALGKYVSSLKVKPIVVGFDTSDSVLALLDAGILSATMQQNPELMGSKGLEIAIQALNGTYSEPKNSKIDTGVTVIKRESLK